jgi:hypothetical protein
VQGRVDGERSGGEVEASRSRLAALFNRQRLSPAERRLAGYITDHPREAPFPQPSRKIDTKLARPLTYLPGMPAGLESLAVRNLLRAWRLNLPSGRRIATAVGGMALTTEELGFEETEYRRPAPLWYYVLRAAEVREEGRRLGPVGGRIVAEVLLGLLEGDPLSFVNVEAGSGWRPHLPSAEAGQFTMADLVRFATS